LGEIKRGLDYEWQQNVKDVTERREKERKKERERIR
jgi:hypothetical protein